MTDFKIIYQPESELHLLSYCWKGHNRVASGEGLEGLRECLERRLQILRDEKDAVEGILEGPIAEKFRMCEEARFKCIDG